MKTAEGEVGSFSFSNSFDSAAFGELEGDESERIPVNDMFDRTHSRSSTGPASTSHGRRTKRSVSPQSVPARARTADSTQISVFPTTGAHSMSYSSHGGEGGSRSGSRRVNKGAVGQGVTLPLLPVDITSIEKAIESAEVKSHQLSEYLCPLTAGCSCVRKQQPWH